VVCERAGRWPVKSPLLAFVLSFFLPGAGLWYLGRSVAGLVNLLLVVVVAVLAGITLDNSEDLRVVGVICTAGSASVAMSLAQQDNQRRPASGA
jgi:hypothetical protein